MRRFFIYIGAFYGFLFNNKIQVLTRSLCNYIRTGYYSKSFKYIGDKSCIMNGVEINAVRRSISLGRNTNIHRFATLSTWDKGEICIMNDVSIGFGSHITSVNRIKIGNGVLLGKYVTITDNSHGNNIFSESDIIPIYRSIVSKGPVTIEDNVWIGEKVTILPGVTIGKGAIVGANSIVSKNVPPYTIVAGIPAKIIKTIK